MKNFTKQNFKTNPLWIRLLIMTFMLLAGVGNLSAAQYNIYWKGKVYFLAPETWNVNDTYKYIQVDITRTTSATSNNHQEYIGNMTRLGTSRLFYVNVDANHSNWNQNEYIAFTANNSNYDSGSFRIDNNHYYTTPLDYGVKDGGYYLFKPSSKTELQTTTNANKITGIWASSRDDFKVDQTVQIYTNGSSSATGGTVKLTGYYLSSDNALSSSSVTSSSTSAKYGSVPGTEMKLTATAKTGYKFDGWYTAATGGTKLSSDATYTYNVYEATTVYARFLSQEYTITYKDQGNETFSGTHASGYPTKHTYGTDTTLKTASKTDYTFGGWFTNSDCTGTEVTSLGATAYTANITLYAKWGKACDDVAAPTLSIDRGITYDCGVTTTGIIAITNYAQFSNCTFTLNGDAVNPTNTGKIEGVTASGSCTVVVTNNCGNSSDAVSIDMPKTTVKAPTVYDVSLTYPQVPFATNTGGVNIYLAQSERDVTYYLYKNGTEVTDSDKQGDGRALVWTVLESGTYTVKADNPCNDGVIDMKGSVEFTCMSNLELAFEGGKSTFCPGETANVIVTFTGTGKGDEDTNGGKFGWQWGGSNYSYESIYLNESGVTMPLTINGDGSISLAVKSCNSTVYSDPLEFTVVTAPEKPQLDDYAMEVCTGETAEIIIIDYNDSYTYQLYKNSTIVETPEFDAGVFTVSEAGSYTVKAVEAECSLASEPSDPFTLTTRGTTITPPVAEIHPYEVVTFTAGEQVKWALYTNPSSGSQLSDDDAKYSGKDTAYITKGESNTTKFKGEAASGYVIHATVGDCTASYTFNVVEDPDNCL